MRRACNHIGFAILAFAISFIAISCTSDDEFFGFDCEDEFTNSIKSNIDLSISHEYLDLDIDTIKKWSKKDLCILDEAEYRMGISFNSSTNEYSKNYRTNSELNISKKLYNRIWENYQHNNLTVNKNSSKKRIKESNPEGINSKYNCVPLTLSYCLATPYSTVVRVCNKVDPNWNTRGVDLGYVGIIVDSLGYSMNTYYTPQEIRNHYGESEMDINAMLITSTGGIPKYHAVRAYYYDGSARWMKKIFYNDYQSGDYNCWMAVSGIHVLFEF